MSGDGAALRSVLWQNFLFSLSLEMNNASRTFYFILNGFPRTWPVFLSANPRFLNLHSKLPVYNLILSIISLLKTGASLKLDVRSHRSLEIFVLAHSHSYSDRGNIFPAGVFFRIPTSSSEFPMKN